ncbi:MAG: hypothetical protein ACF8NJ_05255, partial [Phycisphaerales bacterium JB038]
MAAVPALALLAAMLPAQAAPLTEDLQILGPWRDALRNAQANETVVNSAVVGDSVTTTANTWVYWLRNHLWEHYGNAGEGSLDVHSSSNGDTSGGRVWWPVYANPWGLGSAWTRTYSDGSDTHVLFPTGTWSTCEHQGGGWRMQFEGDQATLRYIEEPGAGTITIELSNQVILTIDADAPVQASTTVEIPLPGPGTHLLEFESTEPQSAPASTKLDLLDVRTGDPGSVLHRWGQPGKPCSHFLEKSEQMYQDLFDTVQPDVLWLQCDPVGEPIDDYEADLRAL